MYLHTSLFATFPDKYYRHTSTYISAAERKLEKELATYEPTQIVKLTVKGSQVPGDLAGWLRERYSRLYINWISTFIQ